MFNYGVELAAWMWRATVIGAYAFSDHNHAPSLDGRRNLGVTKGCYEHAVQGPCPHRNGKLEAKLVRDVIAVHSFASLSGGTADSKDACRIGHLRSLIVKDPKRFRRILSYHVDVAYKPLQARTIGSWPMPARKESMTARWWRDIAITSAVVAFALVGRAPAFGATICIDGTFLVSGEQRQISVYDEVCRQDRGVYVMFGDQITGGIFVCLSESEYATVIYRNITNNGPSVRVSWLKDGDCIKP